MTEFTSAMDTSRKTRIIIFAKAPIPGFCKTRLIGALGAEGAAELAAEMLRRTVAIAKESQIGPVELSVAPDLDHVIWQTINLDGDILWTRQPEGDLGSRMATAIRRSLSEGQSVLCIGTDCIDLEASHLRDAAISLTQHTTVITPALDGGYVLLGLNRFDDSIFEGIAWSTSSVCVDTISRIRRLGWSVAEMKALRDIDDEEDLAFLPETFRKKVTALTERKSK